MTHAGCVFTALILGALLSACGSQPTAPAPIPATTPAPPVTPPPAIPQTGNTLSGVVFENTADGRHPVAGGFVNYYGSTANGFPRVPMDASGRYTIPNLPDGSATERKAADFVASIGVGRRVQLEKTVGIAEIEHPRVRKGPPLFTADVIDDAEQPWCR